VLPVTVHRVVSAPREDVYDLVADLAYRPAWTDHFTSSFRLEHPQSSGEGASARYRLDGPLNTLWLETRIVEAERPRRIVEALRGGRSGRTTGEVVFELTRQGRGLTRVEMTTWIEPGTPREAIKGRLGTRPWVRRRSRVALDRLRAIFEEGREAPLERATVAGWEPRKSPRFGVSPRPEPRVPSG
jgi:uncharacterized protein YndB with AHSA1/START domain